MRESRDARRGGAQLLGAAVPHVAVHDDEGPRRQQECLRTVHQLCRRSRRVDLGAGDSLGGGGDDGVGVEEADDLARQVPATVVSVPAAAEGAAAA